MNADPAAVVAAISEPLTIPRSSTSEVRNPLLGLPAAARIRELPIRSRLALADLLLEVAADADAKAEAAWRKRKGPMAAYWRATSTYAKHTARAIVRPGERRKAARVRHDDWHYEDGAPIPLEDL